jgi:hypothetical protein
MWKMDAMTVPDMYSGVIDFLFIEKFGILGSYTYSYLNKEVMRLKNAK